MRRAIPNLITASRLVLVAPLAMSLWLGRASDAWRWVSIAVFFWTALSDLVDGVLARRLNAITSIGKILDPIADKLVALVCFVALAAASRSVGNTQYYPLPVWLVVIVVGKDAWMVVGYSVIRMMGIHIVVRPSRWGKASTFFEMAMVGAVLVYPELTRLHVAMLPVALIYVVGAVTTIAAVTYTWTAIQRLITVQVGEGS